VRRFLASLVALAAALGGSSANANVEADRAVINEVVDVCLEAVAQQRAVSAADFASHFEPTDDSMTLRSTHQGERFVLHLNDVRQGACLLEHEGRGSVGRRLRVAAFESLQQRGAIGGRVEGGYVFAFPNDHLPAETEGTALFRSVVFEGRGFHMSVEIGAFAFAGAASSIEGRP
jgi:hypothetical protein